MIQPSVSNRIKSKKRMNSDKDNCSKGLANKALIAWRMETLLQDYIASSAMKSTLNLSALT